MSRLAKKPIMIPAGVTAKYENGVWMFRGPKGEIRQTFSPLVSIQETGGALQVSLHQELARREKNAPALLGTTAALVKNALEGASIGYSKKLELEGVGFKVQLEGKDLVFALGFSHPVRFRVPESIVFTVEKNTVTVSGPDKALVGKVAAEVRELKKPEPYKGKGIHYTGEVIRRKAGKKAVSTA